jgi:putative phosphotransacetylase
MLDERIVEKITSQVILQLEKMGINEMSFHNTVPVGISNRHIHLSKEDLETLFGCGYKLTLKKALSQPGEFACEEVLDIKVGERSIKGIRVLGPIRRQTQVEISASDARKLRSKPPVRSSGHLEGSAPVTVIGPKGSIDLKEGLIIANRHIHFTPSDAEKFDIKDSDIISVKWGGEKGGIFDDVCCRVSKNYSLELHIDTDDASAFMLNNGDRLEVLK